MKKLFCDCCGEQITSKNTMDGNYEFEKKALIGDLELEVRIITGINGDGDAGDFCKYCVVDTLKQLDDRDKPSQVCCHSLDCCHE